jgi:hypothetical protein
MKNQHKFVKDEYIYDNFDFQNNSNTQTFTHDYMIFSDIFASTLASIS